MAKMGFPRCTNRKHRSCVCQQTGIEVVLENAPNQNK